MNPFIRNISHESPKESVRLISWLLILMGSVDLTGAVIANILSLIHHGKGINAGGSYWLLIFAGMRLLKRQGGWRTFVLFCCWLNFLATPALVVGAFCGLQTSEFIFAGSRISFAQSPTLWCLLIAVNLALFVFSYLVLIQSEVAQYFKGDATVRDIVDREINDEQMGPFPQ